MTNWKLCLLALSILIPFICKSQDTVVGWTFHTGVQQEILANYGSNDNMGFARIIAADSNDHRRPIFWRNGAHFNDYAATADGWDNGDNNKYWQISFISLGYKDLLLSSKQRSGEVKSGPKYFYIQYKVGSGPWTDLASVGVITLGNDWDTGMITNLQLPSDCYNANDSVHIRWLMHPNIGLNGYEVQAIGTSKIDDIFITGTNIFSNINDNFHTSANIVLPNISSGSFKVIADVETREITIYNSLGSAINSFSLTEPTMQVDLSSQPPGIYFVTFLDACSRLLHTEKIAVSR